MSRYIQQESKKEPPKKDKPKRELSRPGKYTGADLESAKKIISPHGGRR